MKSSSPYQPVLLRLLHGAIAVLVMLALITGFWVYNTYDARWGALPLPKLVEIQGIHGTIALTLLLLLPIFVFYCFHLGYRRLTQGDTIQHLQAFGKPLWWLTVQRLTNTLMLLAIAVAVVTGRMMQEVWLPTGDLNKLPYLAHLGAWVLVLVSLAIHLLLGAKVGGMPLLVSMFRWQIRDGDRPKTWLHGIQWQQTDSVLKGLEIMVVGGIVMAFIVPIFSL